MLATLNEIDPLPLPLAPPVIVNHEGALLAAVQAQPAGAFTLVDPVVADGPVDVLVDVSVYEQPSAA